MGIFNRIKKIGHTADAKDGGKDAAENKADVTVENEGLVLQPQKTARKRVDVVAVAPRISEKSAVLTSSGKYVFDVPVTANKVEVRKAIEALYGVKVQDVNTVRGIGKAVSRGRIAGRRNRWKKAIVTLKKGQKIDLFVGV
ncbi:50S ribosomal protein L23 [Candidatus Uhrbacteria bacterium]|nr:50S ribosomal protein L23 [Candidatus Uhrbacteria bacterium]